MIQQRLYFLCLILLTLASPSCKQALSKPEPVVTDVTHNTASGSCQGKLVTVNAAADAPRQPALLLIHEDHGLTDWELEQARKLASDGYVVLAIDLYGGQKVDSLMDAHIMGRALPEDKVMAALKTAVDYLENRPDVDSSRIGVIGWDMGGGYALECARRDPRLKACVVCYGSVITDPELLTPMKATVLGIFAGQDVGIDQETIAAFRKTLETAGKKHAIKVFANSPHGFMNPASPEAAGKIDQATAGSAWTTILAFLATELKKP